MRQILFIFLYIIFSSVGFTQETVFSGKVVEPNGSPIEGANILIFNSQKEFLKNTFSDATGEFKIFLEPGSEEYHLRISALGYKVLEVFYKVTESSKNNYQEITMMPSMESLNEVLIQAQQHIRIKKDTVVFLADHYRTEGDEVVEDLLRRLPGVEVGEDGGISVNGKEINKILIGGVDIFDQKYRIPSKNIDSRDIEKVEVLYNFNENSVLKTLYNSDDVALNLEFREDRKGRLYGNGEAGGGLKEKYIGHLTLFKLNPGINVFAIGNLNNIGNTGEILLKENFSKRFLSGFNISTSQQLINPENISNSFVDNKYRTRTNSIFNTFNIYSPINRKSGLRLIGTYADDKSRGGSGFRQTYLDDQNTTVKQSTELNRNYKNFSTEALFKFEEKGKIHFEIKSFLEFNKPNEVLSTINTNSILDERLKIENLTFYNTLGGSIKSGDKAIDINLFQLQTKNPQSYILSDPGHDPAFSTLTQDYENIYRSYGIKGSVITTQGSFNIGYSRNSDLLNTYTSDLSSVFFTEYSNDLKISKQEAFVEKGWVIPFFEWFTLSLSGRVSYETLLVEEPMENKNENIHRLNIIPNLTLVRATENFGKFTLQYSYRNNSPGSTDVFSNPILLNRRSFLIGTGESFFQTSNTYSFLHSKSDFRKQLFYSSSLIFIQNINGIGYSNFLMDNFDYVRKEIIEGNNTILGSVKLDKVFSQIKSGISFDYNLLIRKGKTSLNNENLTSFQNLSHTLTFSYGSFFKGNFNFKVGGAGQISKLTYQNKSRNIMNYTTYLDLEYSILNQLSFNLESKQRYPGSNEYNFGFQNLSTLCITYQLKKNKINLYAGVENLTDENEVVDVFLTPVSSFQRSISLVPTFGYIKAKYRF